MAELVRTSLRAAGRELSSAEAEEAAEAEALREGGRAYWSAKLPVAKRCALCPTPHAPSPSDHVVISP